MRSPLGAAVALPFLMACQAVTSAARPPLESEGEIYLYLQPLSVEKGRLAFEVESVSALRTDGTPLPLTVPAGRAPAAGATGQRLLAWGRLAPGNYAGLAIKTRRATLARPDGDADLLVPPEPTRVEAQFPVARQSATVLWLSLDLARSMGPTSFTPVFSIALPPPPVPGLIGWISSPSAGNVTVLDKHTRRVVAVVESAGDPQGVAVDEVQLRGYVASSADDEVRVLDLLSGATLAAIRLRPGDRPRDLGLTPDRTLLVSVNAGSATVSFLDPSGRLEIDRAQTGNEPVSLLIDRSGRRGYVCNRMSNSITVLDFPSRALVGSFATEAQPMYAQLDRAGSRLYVIHEGSPFLTVYAVPDFTRVNRVFIGLGATSLKVDPRTDLLYLSRRGASQIEIIEPMSLISLGTIDVPDDVSYMAIDDTENTLLALLPGGKAVAVVDLTSRRTLALVDAAGEPFRVAVVGERR